MCQIAAGNYVLLVDFFIIRQQSELFSKVSSWIKALMLSTEVVKVFFDCHKDSEALHKGLSCCIRNVYDIQAMHMLIKQWKTESTSDKSVSTPGLNKSLEEYKASHGINEYKETMKEIFSSEAATYEARPLSLMYLLYAAKDVEDLIEVKDKMLAELDTIFKNGMGRKLAAILSQDYVRQGCKSITAKGYVKASSDQ